MPSVFRKLFGLGSDKDEKSRDPSEHPEIHSTSSGGLYVDTEELLESKAAKRKLRKLEEERRWKEKAEREEG
ncbi:hypothetical protein GGQ19_001763 [Salinibacter ruber]|uniref:hypothetical protein n=1 Tax=Salinibacter ruber TaxID=146919 RepID=UPI00216744C7|nr:hypothetical protein [Salinibacter ruber]MCS3750594.1 hypothetical protein [Salinibacter ruber]